MLISMAKAQHTVASGEQERRVAAVVRLVERRTLRNGDTVHYDTGFLTLIWLANVAC